MDWACNFSPETQWQSGLQASRKFAYDPIVFRYCQGTPADPAQALASARPATMWRGKPWWRRAHG